MAPSTPENYDLVTLSTRIDQATMNTITATEKEAATNPTVDDGGEIENPSRPKGVRFAVLFLSIIAGDFFVGYVRNIMKIPSPLPQPRRADLLTLACRWASRTQVVWRHSLL